MATSHTELFSQTSLSVVCNLCAKKIQAVADMLLLTSDPRPVNTETVMAIGESYSKCRDTLIARTKGLAILTRDVRAHLMNNQLHETSEALQELTDLVVTIIECSSHAAYLAAISEIGSKQAVPGVIDRYKITRAKCDIEQGCTRLQITPAAELSPQVVVDISTDIAKSLTILTNASKLASDANEDIFHKEQFKLAIKSVTACTSTLLTSVRRYKITLDERSRLRCVSFSKPLVQSCQALVDYATEPEHVGTPAQLTDNGKKVQTAILGGCMSIASSCVQLCNVTRAASFDTGNPELLYRMTSCCAAIVDGAKLLSQALRDKASPRTLPSNVSSNSTTNSNSHHTNNKNNSADQGHTM